MQFINQIVGGITNIATGGLQLALSPLALIQDITGGGGGGGGGMFGAQQSNQWMGSQQGYCGCGSGHYDPYGTYQHEMTQNARLSNLERRVAYDETMVNYRLARNYL